jgi:hypothetical protein
MGKELDKKLDKSKFVNIIKDLTNDQFRLLLDCMQEKDVISAIHCALRARDNITQLLGLKKEYEKRYNDRIEFAIVNKLFSKNKK